MDYKSISAGELSSLLGVQRSNISHILNGRNKPGASFIEKLLLTFPDLNARWLFTGEGEMVEKLTSPDPTLDPANNPARKTEALIPPEVPPIQQPATKFNKELKVVKVVLFYSDGTFKDFDKE